MSTLTAYISGLKQYGVLVDSVAKEATEACSGVLQARLKANLRQLEHAKNVASVYNLEGEPRPHLWETANAKVIRSKFDNGYLAIVGCRKVGAHISIIDSGTTHRERKARKFVVDPFSGNYSMSFLGSREAGRGGIAGSFVWVELEIMRGLRPSSRRTTGVGPVRPVRQQTMDQCKSQCMSIAQSHFQRLIRNIQSSISK